MNSSCTQSPGKHKAVWGPKQTASPSDRGTRTKVVWGPKRIVTAVAFVALALGVTADAGAAGRHQRPARRVRPGAPNALVSRDKMDRDVAKLASGGKLGRDTANVIVTLEPGADLPGAFQRYSHNGQLSVIHGYVLDQVPVSQLAALASSASVHRVHANRKARKQDALSSVAVNANAIDKGNGINAANLYGYTGAGVTVAFIDSGITSYAHPDLVDSRVLAFVDFVNSRTTKYDDNGHGTHVAGILGGTGKASAKKYAGMAPGVSLVSLKVLNQNGEGSVGAVLRALDWVYRYGKTYGVRVVNLSVGAAVTESYYTDPLTLATKTLVDRGITVVAAAGNRGQNALGQPQWGGIVSPANAPWVLTVCAFSTRGSYNVADDAVANFSSAGPTAVDFSAKPDLCAPGVGVVSTTAPGSTLFQAALTTTPSWLIPGTVTSAFPYLPYESLTGTSMAAPVVSGAIALMLQANPSLTPNLIKAMLEFTAISKPGVSPLRQGAGFLNVSNAVALAALAAHPASTAVPVPTTWAKHILWGNHMLSGGVIDPTANAWRLGVEWGWAKTQADDGDNIVWGTMSDGDNIVWGTAADGDNIVWGTAADGDNIVWGTSTDGDNIVWGTDCGGADCDNIMWGTMSDGDNIVWGTATDGDNIVWGTANDGDNIVWGTANDGDNIVWGTANDGDNIVWGTMNLQNIVWSIVKGGN
jgi:serine protease AprX